MTDVTDSTPSAADHPADTTTEAERQIDTDRAPDEGQAQADQASNDQLQRETDQGEHLEAERLAMLDMETEDDKACRPLDADVWGSTGHAGVDGAMQMLQNCGMSTDDAMELLFDAAATRDPSKVDRKALEAKIGPRRAKAIMEGLEAFSREMRPKDARVSNEVYGYSNGPHELQRLVAQAEQMLSPSEVQDYILALGKGGPTARRAVENLQAIVAGEATPPHRIAHAAPAPQGKAAAGITSAGYVAALSALNSAGSRLSFEARERREAELHEARRIGRENGLR